MSEARHHKARDEQIIALRFRRKASSDEVVSHLLDSIRGTDLSLFTVFGDGDRMYPFQARNPARSASSWHAELFWHSPTLMLGGRLEAFLERAAFLLELTGGVWLELGGGRRNPREDVGEVMRVWLLGAGDDAPTLL